MTEKQKKENLLRNVRILCNILTQNKILQIERIFHSVDNIEYRETDWTVYEDDPATTFMGVICNKYNRNAFRFLKQGGHLDIGVCWHCGESSIKKEYNFSSGQNLDYFICENCYNGGRAFQKAVLGYNKSDGDSNKNCYIATLCYGDINAPQVEEFRKFRDKSLNKHWAGRQFIRAYYRHSPGLVEYLSTKPKLNRLIRIILLDSILRIINWNRAK